MLDINLIRTNTDYVKNALLKKGVSIDFSDLLKWDEEYRKNKNELETLQAKRNKVSSEIPQLKKSGQDVSGLMEEMKKLEKRSKRKSKAVINLLS